MDRHARTPDPLSDEGDMTENWRSWREDFLIFMTVTEYNKKSNEMKANLLKNLIGKNGLAAINSFTYHDPIDKNDLDILLSKLDFHFDPPKTETELRYQFFTTKNQQMESIEEYINELREKAKGCNFGSMSESLVRDKVVLDTRDRSLRTKLMAVEGLTIETLIPIYKEHTIIVAKLREISKGTTDGKGFASACRRCGTRHAIRNCPAWGVKCEKCGERCHFSHCCPQNKSNEKNQNVNKNLCDFRQNNTAGKSNVSSNGPGSTSGTSGSTVNSTDTKKLPNNIVREPPPSYSSLPVPPGMSNLGTDPQSSRPNTPASKPAPKKDTGFVVVPPPSYANSTFRRPQPTFKKTYPSKQKKSSKNDECTIS